MSSGAAVEVVLVAFETCKQARLWMPLNGLIVPECFTIVRHFWMNVIYNRKPFFIVTLLRILEALTDIRSARSRSKPWISPFQATLDEFDSGVYPGDRPPYAFTFQIKKTELYWSMYF